MKNPFKTFRLFFRVILLSPIFLLPSLAQAHPGFGSAGGFANGLAHPFTGWDHLAAMIAVGLWAAQRGGRALWMIPVAFVSVMTLGGFLGMAGLALPFVEKGIVASLLILGVLIAASLRLPLLLCVFLVGVFALFHGHAHGTEMPATAMGLVYGLGFVVATATLHLMGIALVLFARQTAAVATIRYAGGAIAMYGLFLLLAV